MLGPRRCVVIGIAACATVLLAGQSAAIATPIGGVAARGRAPMARQLRPVATRPVAQVAAPHAAAMMGPIDTGPRSMVTAGSTGTSTAGTGNFAATSLKASDSWGVSAQSGSFTYSYPLHDVKPAAGPEPNLSLSYSSASIDGETGATNNQASNVGDGWQIGGTGFIERSYVPCNTDGVATSYDLCWKSDNATLDFGGQSQPIVRDATTGTWRLLHDDGTRIEKLTGTGNGDNDGEYWRVTTPDGTQYYYGLNVIPGTAVRTNSAWTVPVFGNNAGEPCYNATFASASCTQAWRWNLDYVVDTHSNVETLYYTTETNSYAKNGLTTAVTSYIRGGYLNLIDYGARAGSETMQTAPERVLFYNADRCNSTSATCAANHTSAYWPDTPWDLGCSAAPCNVVSPSFWSSQVFTGIVAQYATGSSSFIRTDVYNLTRQWVTAADSYGATAQMVLTGIQHIGYLASGASGGGLSEPSVTFTGTFYANRVNAAAAKQSSLFRQRITGITTDTGATVTVNYLAAQCGASMPVSPQTDTMRCFQQYWTPSGTSTAQSGWFSTYPVSAVSVNPNRAAPNGSTTNDTTSYDYSVGTPAWRYDTSPFTPAAQRTWSVFAGFSKVRVEHGDPSSPGTLETTTTSYFQGMNGDKLAPTGGTRAVSLTASDGSTVPDSPWWAGRALEAVTTNGLNGAAVTDTITTPWASVATADDTVNQAHALGDAEVKTLTALSAGGNRTTDVLNTYDGYGRIAQVNDLGDTATAADDRCTTSTYATSTTANILDLTASVRVVGKACTATPTYPQDGVSYTENHYDGSSVAGAAPTAGDLTAARTASSFDASGAPTTIATATNTYDGLGRLLSETNALNQQTQYAYTPAFTATAPGANLGPVTKVVTTNPLGWTTTEGFDPTGQAETYFVDQNGNRTDAAYDDLGRLVQVWLPDRPKTANPTSPSTSYGYSTTAPYSVATTALTPSGGTTTSYALYDGLMRLRQTQEPAEGSNQQAAPGSSGADVTDTVYDAAGREVLTNNAYASTAAPSATLLIPSGGESTVPSATATTYDGAGRPTATVTQALGVAKWQTSTAYGGDHIDVTPPSGGTPTTTYFDARGNKTSLLQYHGATPSGTADTTRYGYDAAGDMTSMTDPAGDAWSWTYDLFGDKLTATDPDTGTTHYSYDNGQRLTQTVDARGATVGYGYDALNRRTSVTHYQASPAGWDLDRAWTYDTLAKGQLTSTTRYVGSAPGSNGAAYTTAVTGYDARYRPMGTSVTLPATQGALAGTYTTTTAYNPDGSIKSQTDPAEGGLPAETVQYGYTAIGHLSDVTVSGGTYHLSYDSIAELTQAQRSGGAHQLTDSYSYDPDTGRLTGQVVTNVGAANPTLASRSYSYDNAGDVTKVANSPSGQAADTQCFSYDYLQRLTRAFTPATGDCTSTPTAAGLGGPAPYWQSYGYDSAGDRTSITRHATSSGGVDRLDSYSYSAAGSGHQLRSVSHQTAPAGSSNYAAAGSDSYGYDAAGDTTSAPGEAMSYDAQGQLSSITAGGKTQTRVYGTDGALLVRSDPVAGTTAFVGDTEVTVSPAGQLSASRTYQAGGSPFACRTTAPGGTSTTLTWLASDPQNTATVAVDAASGAATVRYFDPFGADRDAAAPSWPNRDGFLNAPADPFTGTTRLGARDYSPTLGRFLTVDPVLDTGDPQQIDGYAYALNNPITNADPSGLCVHADGLSCGATCGGSCGLPPAGHNEGGDMSRPMNNTQAARWNGGIDRYAYHAPPPAARPAPAHRSGGLLHLVKKAAKSFAHGTATTVHDSVKKTIHNLKALNPITLYNGCTGNGEGINRNYGDCFALLGEVATAGCIAATDGICAGAAESGTVDEAGTADAGTEALSRLPAAARASEKPPGFNPETWQWRSGSRNSVGMDWWDPEGGEWRYHPADKYHDPHWDYNPWTQWNSPWQHLGN